ncbi:MAG: polysaccharide biosynthesis protein [Bacteroidales bacterium]|nr:polysaccharide biosynthesis protein [Clostridium sp.]MCM1202686.1 polysaccharide biosynthesis protein [Bacteroidales bacterium]
MNIKSRYQRIRLLISRNLVIKGTLILTLTGFATRIIGFYNRIFLAGLIGAKELGIYQLIFPLYMVAFSFTTFGNELALTKLVSEYNSRRDYGTARAFFKTCFFINLLSGLLITIIMYRNAGWLCTHILNAPECEACLKVISLGIPFMAMKGAIHGYFLGLEKSGIHGISDFLEQTAKVLGLYLLSTYIFVQSGYDAAFAVRGIVIGEIVSFLFSLGALYIHDRKNRRRPAAYPGKDGSSVSPIRRQKVLSLFFRDALPLTANRLTLTALQSMEAIIIPTVLLSFYHDSTKSLATYGVFSGMAFPFIMFPSTITNSLSTMLLPAVSSASSRLNAGYLKRLCEKSLHFCLLVGLFSTTVFYIFGPSIGGCFFQNKEAGTYLYQLSFLCPFIYLATNLASILNGLGFASHNLMLTVAATGIRLGFILFTVPRIGIYGYIIGLFTGYLFLTFACLFKLQSVVPVSLSFSRDIFFPAAAFILTGAAAFFCYRKLLSFSGGIPEVVVLIAVLGIYGVICFTGRVKALLRE